MWGLGRVWFVTEKGWVVLFGAVLTSGDSFPPGSLQVANILTKAAALQWL